MTFRPKKIVFLSFGSRGDAAPHVAVGLELQRRGFSVTIATHPEHESLVRGRGLDFFPISMSFADLLKSETGFSLVNERASVIDSLKSIKNFSASFKDRAKEINNECLAACEGADAIVGSPVSLAPHIAEYLNIPCFLTSVYPINPTREFANPLISPKYSFGESVNYLSYKIVEQIFWLGFKKLINRSRARLKLPPIMGKTMFDHFNTTNTHYLMAFSEHLLVKTGNWSNNVHVTGQWDLSDDESWEPPPSLVKFIEEGEAPLYIGFGSMNKKNFANLQPIVEKALEKTGQRAIFLNPYCEENGESSKLFYSIRYAPHQWLLNHTKAAIHHGGSGTIHTCTRAGLPSLIVPFLGDQFFWANQVHQLGIGPKYLKLKKLSADSLAAQIKKLINREEYFVNAKRFQKKLLRDDGISRASSIIESLL